MIPAMESAPGSSAGGVVARLELMRRMGGTRVTLISAAPGSGKSVLLRSWAAQDELAGRVAWVPVGQDERDPQRFWLSVLDALRRTGPGAALVGDLTATPDLDGWAAAERLLADLAPLRDRLWLAVDDVHELGADALRQIELLVMRAPAELRFVLATRHDTRLGLHRLRLEGEVVELRVADLVFSAAEARELFGAAGVELSEAMVAVLHERTEGWAAGLRLAALSLAGRPDPARFVAEFSGSERTVAEYLVAEVLDRQDERVRRLLLRTSVLERVNGELADLLTGGVGGERVLQDLEDTNAFVVSQDASRSWFRYHQMFAELLASELRRTAPGEVAGLHRSAGGWFAAHGYAVEAIRHAQAAGDWPEAARLLADQWPSLHLDGRNATVHDLLSGFPLPVRTRHAELAAVVTADELARGSVENADRYLGLAERGLSSVPDTRRHQAQLLVGIVRLLVARQRGNLPAVVDEARRLQVMADTPDMTRPGLGEDLRALALISLGITQYWTGGFDDAVRHLEAGIALAHRIGRPYLEFNGLGYLAGAEWFRSFSRAAGHGMRAIELAQRTGRADDPAACNSWMVVASVSAWQGRLPEAEVLTQRAERALRAEAHPAQGLAVYYVRAIVDLGCGRIADALAAFRRGERLAAALAMPNPSVMANWAFLMQTQVRLGEIDDAEQALAKFDDQDRDQGDLRLAAAVLRLAQDDPRGALAELGPVLDGSRPLIWPTWLVQAHLLETMAHEMTGDYAAADQALERALDRAEPDGAVLWFLLYPTPDTLKRHVRHRTSHAALVAEIDSLLSARRLAAAPAEPRGPMAPLSGSELRVLRYLPTHLSAPEIAGQLSVSHNTVKTHMRNLYSKLGAHRRAEAVVRARELGLLAPSAIRR
jgi:LuxR family maltose regulon positive regulatory protein